MPRPLQKQKRDGTRYARQPDVEEGLDAALQQDEATLAVRANLGADSAEYLPSECLVHLIRDAKRIGNRRRLAALVLLLHKRCAGNLRSTVKESLPAAEQLRQEVLSNLNELIAKDGTSHDNLRLDFFEVRFDSAFQKLRLDVVRKYLKLASEEDVALDIEGLGADHNDDTHEQLAKREQLKLISDNLHLLSDNERTAVGLRYLEALKLFSEDPDEPTVAKLMRVSDRTARTYLRSAERKLRALEGKP